MASLLGAWADTARATYLGEKTMRTTRILLVLFLASLSMPAVAEGTKLHIPVAIHASAAVPFAEGAVRDARAGRHTGQYIRCEVGNLGPEWVQCYARGGFGDTARCHAASTEFAAVASAISSASYIAFSWDPDSTDQPGYGYTCTDLRVVNSSEFMPVSPNDATPQQAIVIVNRPNANYVIGRLLSASNSASPYEYLSCGSWASGGVVCVARTATGRSVWCSADASANPGVAQAVRSIDDSSDVTFYYDPATNRCLKVVVSKGS
jgi:hypothetical protein